MPLTKRAPSAAETLDSLALAAWYLKNYPANAFGTGGMGLKTAVFKKKYFLDPVGFAKDCIEWRHGQGLTPYQEDIMRSLIEKKRISVRSPHGSGKTAMLSILILWFALTRDGLDWKCVTTASVWRQLERYLWPEVHKWVRLLRWDVIGRAPFDERTEMLSLSLKLSTGAAFAAASNKPALIEGTHADHLLFIYDEAKSVPEPTFDATEGAFAGAGESGTEAFALAFSTPGEPNGRFYDIQAHKPGFQDWSTRFITRDEVIAAGRMTQEWADNRKLQWGETSTVYKQRVLGEFASSDSDGVIPLAWVEHSNELWKEWDESGRPGELKAIGCDPAAGGDQTVIAPLFGNAISELRRYAKAETMETAARVAGLYEANKSSDPSVFRDIVVDSIGIGAGIVDRLREVRLPVRAFNAATRTTARDMTGELGFVNHRAQGWWQLREMLDPKNATGLALPPDDRLTGDLVAPKYKLMSGPVGRIQIESKDELRKPERLGRSTDDGDAVMMAVSGSSVGFHHLVEFMESGVYTCTVCGEPVLDMGDDTIRCPHCGATVDKSSASLISNDLGPE